MIPIIFGSLDFQLGWAGTDETFLGDKNILISTF